MLKFNLNEGEVIRKVKYTKEADRVKAYAVWSFLKVLNHEGILPKGYMTRVQHGHISMETVAKMVNKLEPQSSYRLEGLKVKDTYYVALVEKAKVVKD